MLLTIRGEREKKTIGCLRDEGENEKGKASKQIGNYNELTENFVMTTGFFSSADPCSLRFIFSGETVLKIKAQQLLTNGTRRAKGSTAQHNIQSYNNIPLIES